MHELGGAARNYEDLLPTRINLPLRFADVDMMHVVHHATCLHWFEALRFAFMSRVLHISIEDMLQSKTAFPVTGFNVDYKHAVRFTDTVYGMTGLTAHKNATFTFHYYIFTEARTRQPSITGHTKHCYTDSALSLLLQPPEPYFSALKRVAAERIACVQVEVLS